MTGAQQDANCQVSANTRPQHLAMPLEKRSKEDQKLYAARQLAANQVLYAARQLASARHFYHSSCYSAVSWFWGGVCLYRYNGPLIQVRLFLNFPSI